VKQEKCAFLANNPSYTKRFAFYVGKRCSTSTVKDVARELHLDRKTVNGLEKQYMREKLRRARNPRSKIIGIDEISIRKGHILNLVLSGLAAIQAPIIIMSQNRQETKDRLRNEFDYSINLKAELEIRHLHEKIDHLLKNQWHRLLEIQEIPMELMEELALKMPRRPSR
jgi:hypothetical protein